jgi:uncharacterized FAD-dependent dehydrogenase
MIKEIELRLSADKGSDVKLHHSLIISKLKLQGSENLHFKLLKRSLDARKKRIIYVLKYLVYIDEEPSEIPFSLQAKKVDSKKSTIIIGSGPAGLFAAIQLLEKGIKPIIVERGKDVRKRRVDLANINQNKGVNPDSNYCFGEGGAGTYSDGKLYTRSKKRGSVERILKILVHFGADPSILIEAHPHIGTNKLPQIISSIREFILNSGGEFHFDTRVCDIIIKDNQFVAVVDQNNKKYESDNVIVATGHSANDIYELFYKKKIALEAKSFAIGIRIEHPQQLIDQIQYQCVIREDYLPPASYSLINRKDERGAYSFCMCPGGIIAPCATSEEETVTNGWSPSKRNNEFANSGIVVPVYPTDFEEFSEWGPLAGLKFREAIEKKAWETAGKTQQAPAQRLIDFMHSRKSKDLPSCSYTPGIVSVELRDVLPTFIIKSLKRSFKLWGKKMPRFNHKDAVLVGVESRTSSPVRIPRDSQSNEHIEIKGLYPSGEGAGYAGGIISAAIDGEKCANSIAEKY